MLWSQAIFNFIIAHKEIEWIHILSGFLFLCKKVDSLNFVSFAFKYLNRLT